MFDVVETKRCAKCSQDKPASDYHRNKQQRSGLHPYCKACVIEYQQARYRQPQHLQRKKEYDRKRADQKRALREKMHTVKRRRRASPSTRRPKPGYSHYRNRAERNGRLVEFNEARARARREWLDRNPGKRAEYRLRQRLRRAGRPEKAPWCSWSQLWAVERSRQAASLRERREMAVDHIYPLHGRTVSGLNCPDNLRIVPADLNRSKKNKLPGFLAHELWDPNCDEVFHE